MWDLLHATAFLADANRQGLNDLMRSLTKLLPCKYCRESFVGFYAKLSRPRVGHGSKWVYEAHQLVNDKLRNQRIEAFVKKHPVLSPEAVATLVQDGKDLYADPSFEVVQKRFMVNRDEPISWRGLSTVLLALLMGLHYNHVQNFQGDLKAFLMAVMRALEVSKQANAGEILLILEELLALAQKGATAEALRTFVEAVKYDKVLAEAERSKASGLIKAGACISGTCA